MAASNGHGLQIPVIHISQADESTGNEMVDAAARYGFLYVRAAGTDFTPRIVDSTFELVSNPLYSSTTSAIQTDPGLQARGFFESPLEEKTQIAIPANVCSSMFTFTVISR